MKHNKKPVIATHLDSLFGNNYKEHIEVGKEYWWYFDNNSEVYKKLKLNWTKLQITYMRSGVAFYIIPGYENYGEHFFPLNSIMAQMLEVAVLDPVKELGNKLNHIEGYCFNDERTIIVNFENKKYYED